MRTPAAGAPRAVSSTCVDSRAMSTREAQPEASVGGRRLGVHAQLLAPLGDRQPGAVVRFEMHFCDGRNFIQQAAAYLINDLLDAARFEGAEYLSHHLTDSRRDLVAAERRLRISIPPLQVE